MKETRVEKDEVGKDERPKHPPDATKVPLKKKNL
jgi:hypothetical protein